MTEYFLQYNTEKSQKTQLRDTITDRQGNIVQQSEYKPFGEQYRIDNNISQPLLTNRGYTGHEHINEFGFIHSLLD